MDNDDGFNDVPANRFFDFEMVSASEGQAIVAMPVRPDYIQEAGVVHGGVLTALADTSAAYAVNSARTSGDSMIGIEVKMSFLRPAIADAGELRAWARTIKSGRRVSVAEVDIEQTERLVARGTFTFLHRLID